MEKKPDSNPRLLHIIIPAATTLLVALIGLGTAMYQTEKPIQLTEAAQTAQAFTQIAAGPTLNAQASQSALAPTFVAQTVAAAVTATVAALPSPVPSQTPTPIPISTATLATNTISVSNKLNLPIKLSVNNNYVSDLDAGGYQTLTLDHFPATLTWEIVKQTTVKGMPLGHDMGGTFHGIREGDEIVIDNEVDNQLYFYPIINNTTGTDCDVTINKGWKSEYVTGAVVGANQSNIGFGYYELYTNSNVTLDCGGKIFWWGEQPDETNATSFFDQVEKDTGIIYFTLKP
jgi:hypothetical protein